MTRGRSWLAAAILALAAAAVYLPALGGARIWDDDAHVTGPALRSAAGLGRIWFEPGATQQYYPVLHSVFWLEHRLWGDAVAGYHLVTLLWHLLAACLFACVLRRLADGREGGSPLAPGGEWLAAALFALHPVAVESVAWISEQKNTLSAVFYLGAALAYVRWRDRPAEKRGRWGGYSLALGLFVLALLTKSVTATLPAALLVALWWRRGRLEAKADVAPLVPWLALGAASGLFTAWVERAFVGASGADYALGAARRLLLAGRAVCFYAGKLAWPFDLAFIYPRWTWDGGAVRWIAYPAAALLGVGALWLLRRRARAPLAAGLFFAGTLFPALGLFDVYPFRFSYVADHWQYLAMLGPLALAGAALAGAGARAGPGARRAWRAAAIALLAGLGFLSWRQARLYRDPRTLYEATLARNPACWLLHDELGNLLLMENRLDEARAHYEAALRWEPRNAQAHHNLGVIHHRRGERPEAIAEFRRALELRPDSGGSLLGLGDVECELGRYEEAIADYRAAPRLSPDLAADAKVRLVRAHDALGASLAEAGRPADAERAYWEALALDPGDATAHANLGAALANLNRWDEAVGELREAVYLAPSDPAIRRALELAEARRKGRP